MAAYSSDLRERILDAVERQVASKRQIARLFGVHESFIYKLLRQKRLLGHIAPLPHGGGAKPKLAPSDLAKLSDLVAHSPDATLDELRDFINKKSRLEVSSSTICRGLKSLGLSRKKSRNSHLKPIHSRGPSSEKGKGN